MGRCLEIWIVGLVGQDTWGFGDLAGRQNLLFLKEEVGVIGKWNLLRSEEGGKNA